MPGADAAALSVYYPTYFGLKVAVPTDYHYTRADGLALDATVLTEFVSPGFFDLFRFHLLKGPRRLVGRRPGETGRRADLGVPRSRGVPGRDEIGQHIRIAGPDRRDIEVIGVVADAPYVKLDDPTPLVVFRPIMQETARTQFPMAYVRAKGDLATVRDGYTRVIKSLGHRSLRAFITSSEWVDGALVQERFTAALATFAAALTVLLACMGVTGCRVLRDGAETGNRCAQGAGSRARDGRLDDRAGRSGDRGAWRAHRRGVRVGGCAARPGAALRRRPRRSPNAAGRRSHPACHGARRITDSGAARVEGDARRCTA